MTPLTGARTAALVIAASLLTLLACDAPAQRRETLTIRGRAQTLRVYGARGGIPVIVSSGDGGWIHLAPHVAAMLAAHGFFVVGFDAKAYLEGFTSGKTTLNAADVPADYGAIAAFAGERSVEKPILIGVSEGAGLSVLAAADDKAKAAFGGVIGLGLPEVNELGWRWRDAIIYLTHRTPNEPTFTITGIADRVAPLPLAAIHSTRDEFVPPAVVEQILAKAKEPKKLWMVEAADHRFSDNQAGFDRTLLEAITWIRQTREPSYRSREPAVSGGTPQTGVKHPSAAR